MELIKDKKRQLIHVRLEKELQDFIESVRVAAKIKTSSEAIRSIIRAYQAEFEKS